MGGASGAENQATAGAAGTGGEEADCAEVARRSELVYLHCRTAKAWDAALAGCEARAGTLIELADPALENEIYRQLDLNAWIGLFVAPGATQFTWTDGTPLGAEANWRPTEPTGDGRCVQVIAGITTPGEGHWNDLGCPAEQSYLCQVPVP